jgi:LAO/AO transport system kinase
MPHTGHSIRIGISGVPGVGKSTFIESFGQLLTKQGRRVGVLTIDPSSQKTKGSILGDKTRMEKLSQNPNVFIRPSPSALALGGVTYHTREAILLCEAAGFDVILVETVGVGQSETSVRNMVDFLLLLMLAGAGDELQGLKKGIMEMVDGIAINKADGTNLKPSQMARADALNALHLQHPSPSGWVPHVLTISSIENRGIEDVWRMILAYQQKTTDSGYFDENRKAQYQQWLEESIEGHFRDILNSPAILKQKNLLLKKVMQQTLLPAEAARSLWRRMSTPGKS